MTDIVQDIISLPNQQDLVSPHRGTMSVLHMSLWKEGLNGLVCQACERRCTLVKDQVGYCSAIINRGDRLYSTAYGVVSEASVSPIERRPVYHYRPTSRVLTLGGLGCNLRCAFCQNWEVAYRDARHGAHLQRPNLTPEQAVALALDQNCQGLGWSFNEPSISPMYTFHCARLAREAGLYTVLVTNGLMTIEALRLLGPYIDVYRVDAKSLSISFYEKVAHMKRVETILPLARQAQQEYGIHVEVVTNLMPGLNDSDDHITALAQEILVQLGNKTPWHLTTYIPYAHMLHIPPTPPETLEHAYTLGSQAGLGYIYTHSVAAPERGNTCCYACQALLIERQAGLAELHELAKDGRCMRCGQHSDIIVNTV